MAWREKKKIDTEFGIIEIIDTGEKVSYDYGRRNYTRNIWKDSEGRIWVAHFNRFNMLSREGLGIMKMYANSPYGHEIKEDEIILNKDDYDTHYSDKYTYTNYSVYVPSEGDSIPVYADEENNLYFSCWFGGDDYRMIPVYDYIKYT